MSRVIPCQAFELHAVSRERSVLHVTAFYEMVLYAPLLCVICLQHLPASAWMFPVTFSAVYSYFALYVCNEKAENVDAVVQAALKT